MAKQHYLPIEDHGVIGDLFTVALIGIDGSLDFLCFPDFDSPSIFAALLDREKGGHFQIAPTSEGFHSRQLYIPGTNILLTRFHSPDGIAELTDFMPISERNGQARQIIRRVSTVRGAVDLRMVCQPAFNYARTPHDLEWVSPTEVFVRPRGTGDSPAVRVLSSVPMRGEEGLLLADFHLGSRDGCETFLLEEVSKEHHCCKSLAEKEVEQVFQDTLRYWQNWINQCQYRGRWREMVNRSALVLKLLTSHKHGSIVAAPTFSLPEAIPGERNWDYRYTWIRDASFTLYGLIRLGYTREAGRFMHWVEDRCQEAASPGELKILYQLNGGTEARELILDHLEGYRGTGPVRIGNGAADQLQLDIYGELLDSVYLFNKYGDPIHHDLWSNITVMVNWVCDNWRREDYGIWEVRDAKAHFLYSRLLCWVALDRAMRLADKRSLPAPAAKWREARDSIYRDIWENFWSEKKQAFVQTRGSEELDAAALTMPLLKFISPADPRWLSTMRALENELIEDIHVYRYRHDNPLDNFEGEEGSFCMCSFWYIECLALSGELDKARLAFEKMLGYANHLGLFAEEVGPHGEHLGNFPQAFTHLALISTAHRIDRMLP